MGERATWTLGRVHGTGVTKKGGSRGVGEKFFRNI